MRRRNDYHYPDNSHRRYRHSVMGDGRNSNRKEEEMIISMAWTTEAFIKGTKTVTRRFWTPQYAAKFHIGDIVDVYNRSPRNGGKKIGRIQLTKDPYLQKLCDMPGEHFEREGGKMYWHDKIDFISCMGGLEAEPWVIEFEKMDIND